MRPPKPLAGLLAALALAAVPAGADDAGAPRSAACPDGFAPGEDPFAVVRGCEKAAGATDGGPRERASRLVALAKLYASLERAVCGPCGYGPNLGARCDAFLAFVEADPGAFRLRESGAGYEYTGRELELAAKALRNPGEPEELKRLARSLAAIAPPPECAYPAPGTECTVPLGPDPVRTVRRCLASLQPNEHEPAKLLGAGFLCVGLDHACRGPAASCAGAEALFSDFPEVFPDNRHGPATPGTSHRYRGRFEREVLRRWPETPGAADALWAAALTESDVEPGPCPRSVPDERQDRLVAIALGCDRSAYAAEGAAQPAYLLAAGRLFEALVAKGAWGLGSSYDRALRAREDLDFVKDPVSGWRYTGRHYRWILERFPSAAEADDAEWALANFPARGDCRQASAACELAPVLPIATYASRRPSGGHVEEAIARTNQRLAAVVARFRSGAGTADPDAERPVLEEYEALARTFPAGQRAATDELLQAWRAWLDGAARAKHLAR